MFNVKLKVDHCDLYFLVIDFVLYLADYFIYKHDPRDNDSVWPNVWMQTKKQSLCLIFYGPVISLHLEVYLMYKHEC